ncbi:hypothetical protein BV898_08912 [Hypsibius exemplaris]|uniref:Receptor ligand binding region domain-containing protein n=1 Tax=Hypsibius exemplaris TaxID=2072580 RepID=A0A1W0WPB7_HYPEX|nr:hypothetical protein BV898_08912 [Hypsibius exemplaris]
MTFQQTAVASAVQRLRDLYPKHHWTWTLLAEPQNAVLGDINVILAQWYNQRRNPNWVHIIVGLACLEALPMSDLLGNYDVLLITSGGSDRLMRDRQRCPTFLSTTPYAQSGAVVCSLLNVLNWTTVFVGLDSQVKTSYHQFSFNQITNKLVGCGVTFTATTAPFSTGSSISRILMEFNRKSRVFLYFGEPPGLRNLLIAAAESEMTHGDHVYLAICQLNIARYGIFTWQQHD